MIRQFKSPGDTKVINMRMWKSEKSAHMTAKQLKREERLRRNKQFWDYVNLVKKETKTLDSDTPIKE